MLPKLCAAPTPNLLTLRMDPKGKIFNTLRYSLLMSKELPTETELGILDT